MSGLSFKDAWVYFEAKNMALGLIHLGQDVQKQVFGGESESVGSKFAPKRFCQG